MRHDYTAIIPVAGTGTRLRPHTYTYPKVLLTVADKPILGHILDKLKENNFKKICLVIGYLGEKVKDYVSKKYSEFEVSYVVQEEQKGLGHAIWLSRPFVNGPAFIILGDTIIEADMPSFLKGDCDKIGVKKVSDPSRFGVVKVKKGYIEHMVEKPEKFVSDLAIVGLYSFKDSSILFDSLEELANSGKTTRGEMQLTDAMSLMIKKGHRIKPVNTEGWFDCGKPETLLATNRHILSSKKNLKYPEGAFFAIKPSYISPSARIKNSIIGPNVSVGDNCLIENSIISDSIINENAEIKNANLDKSLIGPSAVVNGRIDSINIGENSEIRLSE